MSHYTGAVPGVAPGREWLRLGACRGHEDPDLWYATSNTVDGNAQIHQAQAICHTCPVLQQCARWALENREAWGVWGGVTERERRKLLKIRIKNTAPETKAPAKDTTPRNKGARPPALCGTRSAYQRHVKKKEPIDDACRVANTAADRRLRNTGTTKAAA